MPGLKKNKARQKFNYASNRKRMQQKALANTKHYVKVGCKELKDSWDHDLTAKENMAAMGIILDANKMAPIPSTKKRLVAEVKLKEQITSAEKEVVKVTKPEVVEKLEAEANIPKTQKFRFCREQVMWISSMIDKHGDDYKAMARDKKNHFQETPKVIKGKVLKFKSIPEQYAIFARERGLIEKSEPTEVIEDTEVVEEEMESEALEIEEEEPEEVLIPKDSQGKRKRQRKAEKMMDDIEV